MAGLTDDYDICESISVQSLHTSFFFFAFGGVIDDYSVRKSFFVRKSSLVFWPIALPTDDEDECETMIVQDFQTSPSFAYRQLLCIVDTSSNRNN